MIAVTGTGLCTEPTRAAILNRHCARRASPFAHMLASAFQEAAAGLDLASVGAIFGSALGESDVMLQLLDQMWRAREEVSPMLFAVSVHNAASGLVSISTDNRGFTTSIAADHDTPAMALMEAMAFVRTHRTPAVVVCGDAAAPAGLVAEAQRYGGLAAAVAVSPSGDALAHLDGISRDSPSIAPLALPRGLANHPQVGFWELVQCIRAGHRGRLRLDHGAGRGYSVALA
jgi:hypothetical protein